MNFPIQANIISVEFRVDKLIVRFPTIGHEIVSELFHVMSKASTGYPERYRRSSVAMGGSANIHNSGGYKSPDFSLYKIDEDNRSEILDRTSPMIVFEVAYTQPSRKVELEAAHHICLTRGQVQLVIAIYIVHRAKTKPRELVSVTWSHWEEDVRSYREADDGDESELNVVHAEWLAIEGGRSAR